MCMFYTGMDYDFIDPWATDAVKLHESSDNELK